MMSVKVVGTGRYLPSRSVTNAEIAPRLDSSEEWILSHTGISSRHIAAADESSSSMGATAAKAALEMSGVAPEDIGMIIVATTTPDYSGFPSTACLIQARLGCVQAAGFDISAACSGFVYGLEMAKCYLTCHPQRKALVIGTEVLSRQVDWSDRTNAMLFGDGAGAVVLAAEDGGDCTRPSVSLLGADGRGSQLIKRDDGYRSPLGGDPLLETARMRAAAYLTMDGHAVFTFAVRKLDGVLRVMCDKAGIEPAALDFVVPHQANLRIIEAVARRMKLPLDRFYVNLGTIGNTSSASVPICLDEALRNGVLKPGMRYALIGFGAGLTWAGELSEWPYI